MIAPLANFFATTSALSTGNTLEAIQIAKKHHVGSQFIEAAGIYPQVLQLDADAQHLLRALAYQRGATDVAIDLIRQAIAIRSTEPLF